MHNDDHIRCMTYRVVRCCFTVFVLTGVFSSGSMKTATGQDVAFRLMTTDLLANPVSNVALGETFLLHAYVEDLTPSADGVFSAYMDLTYPSSMVTVDGPITYGANYPNGQRGNTAVPGLVDEVGAFDGISPLGPGENLLFSIPFQAEALGAVVFETDPADVLPIHEVLLYDEPNRIPSEQISYGLAALTVVPEPSSSVLLIFGSLIVASWRKR